jgi:molecular chaperone GrpE
MRKTGKEQQKEKDLEQNMEQDLQENPEKDQENPEKDSNPESDQQGSKIAELESQLEKKEAELRESKEQLQRLAAEFDNYKKRTAREKEKLYASSVADVVAAFIPVVDNVDLALKASESGDKGIRDGVQLIRRQLDDILSNLKVKPIETIGEEFNPDFHEAVMHVEDETHGENEIIEEFRKGYIYKDEIVIRHSVVKVAN